MKRIISLLLCTITIFCLYSCNSGTNNDPETVTEELESVFETQPETTLPEATTENIDYDIVLAMGEDKDGNLLRLLAKEYEDYSGTTIEVGVAKGGELIVDFTSDSPFVEDGGLFYLGRSISDIKEKEKQKQYPFKYIGEGCFAYENIFYNIYNQKSYNLNELFGSYYAKLDFGNYSYINDRDNIVLVSCSNYNDNNVYILNTETMELSQAEFEMYDFFAYGDGIFVGREGPYSEYGFYNLDGEMLFSLNNFGYFIQWNDFLGGSEYETIPVFSRGKCTFYTKNDQDSVYKITIDKQGDVLESEKIR